MHLLLTVFAMFLFGFASAMTPSSGSQSSLLHNRSASGSGAKSLMNTEEKPAEGGEEAGSEATKEEGDKGGPSFWSKYKYWIIGAVAVILILIALSVFMSKK